jgi:hypothetical protein
MPKEGLDDETIENETAIPLPERDAMSIVDGGIKLVPMSPIVIPNPAQPVDGATPVDTTGQGMNEKVIPE